MSTNLKEILRELKSTYIVHLKKYEPASDYELVCRGVTNRLGCISTAVSKLSDRGLPNEMAILHRAGINLHWIFRYLTSTIFKEGKWHFEDVPSEAQLQLCKKYLNWHWIDLARQNPENDKFIAEANKAALDHGYRSYKEVPFRFKWYHDQEIQSIWNLVEKIRGTTEYDTYGFLSGLEHSDSSSIHFGELADSAMESDMLGDSVFIFGLALDSTLKICRKAPGSQFVELMHDMDTEIAKLRQVLRDKLRH